MSLFEQWVAEVAATAEAKGMAEGKAKGILDSVLHMVTNGRATIDDARAEIEDLATAGTITRAQADAALAKLG